jgi:hypothetical protein
VCELNVGHARDRDLAFRLWSAERRRHQSATSSSRSERVEVLRRCICMYLATPVTPPAEMAARIRQFCIPMFLSYPCQSRQCLMCPRRRRGHGWSESAFPKSAICTACSEWFFFMKSSKPWPVFYLTRCQAQQIQSGSEFSLSEEKMQESCQFCKEYVTTPKDRLASGR